jgi:glycosyltransferase involved in cell wall biosynthesis
VEEQAERDPGSIEVVPWVDHSELPRLIKRMHALALPSVEVVQRNVAPWMRVPLREQFGRVLVEAMSCGVPVVASRVGEIAHVVGNGGVVVPPGDPAALAHALADLRDRPELAERLSRLGLARATRFDWERIADQLSSEWRRLAPRPAAAGAWAHGPQGRKAVGAQ